MVTNQKLRNSDINVNFSIQLFTNHHADDDIICNKRFVWNLNNAKQKHFHRGLRVMNRTINTSIADQKAMISFHASRINTHTPFKGKREDIVTSFLTTPQPQSNECENEAAEVRMLCVLAV